MKSFTFSVLVYNHEDYVVEHLESIKYLIDRYRPSLVDLIVSDDKSMDGSRELIDSWLRSNDHFFRNILKIYNEANLGTVACTKNIVEKCETDVLKITAADDVYSFENIFYYSNVFGDSSIVSGLPYYLRGTNLASETFSNAIHIASSIIYKGHERFEMLHATNAPNVIYNLGQLRKVIDSPLFDRVKIVEDLLIQVLLSKDEFRFTQLYVPLVYYRRTLGSAYLIQGSQFDVDQRTILEFQISQANWFKGMLLQNKYFCFGIENRFVKYIANLPFYIFLLKSLLNFRRILRHLTVFSKKNDLSLHKSHYSLINDLARCHENTIE
jgi:glycosyltransferase involved in cell wall biosynthesis